MSSLLVTKQKESDIDKLLSTKIKKKKKKTKKIDLSDIESSEMSSSERSSSKSSTNSYYKKSKSKGKKYKNSALKISFNKNIQPTPVSNFFPENDSYVSNKNISDLPWIEKYRPQTLSSITSHDNIIHALEKFVENKSLPHILFYGPPGTGKTSTIIACAKDLYKSYYPYMVLEFNASDERGVDVVRDKIKTFVSSQNFFCKGFKLVILDETDAMTYDAQKILRQVIEKYSSNARFCLICNYVSKIINALQSRCTKFRFSPLSNDQMFNKLSEIVDEEGIDATEKGIRTIIKLSCGDMRKALNILQSTFMTFTKITESSVYQTTNCYKKKDVERIFKWITKYPFNECYKKIEELKYKKGLSLKNLLSDMADYLVEYNMNPTSKMRIFDKLAKIEYNETSTSNDKIQLGALISIFKLVGFEFE